MDRKMFSCFLYSTLILQTTIIQFGTATNTNWNYLQSQKSNSESIPLTNVNNIENSSENEDEDASDSPNTKGGDAFWDLSNKEISEICGTVSSLKCGNQVLGKKNSLATSSKNGGSLNEKCKLREEFLHCIDMQRQNCRKAAGNYILPLLPPKQIINKLQENVWKALWTSGGCVLGT